MTYIRSEPRPDLEAMAQADMERALKFSGWLDGLFDTPAQRWLVKAGPVARRINEGTGGDASEPVFCTECNEAFVYEDELCLDCWNDINGQFGVGA